ncbi:MAG: prolipoprotein diacylglyceryl transferase [Bacteroidales bacterium]|nr:prolipoprotein diacylglyceryl transferase [Bacteroidales bacterium]
MLDYIVWNADPILIHLGPLQIRWYGLMFAIGFWIGTNLVAKMFRHEGAPEKWVGILLVWVVGATIIGARLGHVFFYEWDYYSQHPEKIIAFWEGGLASHGGTIAIVIAVFLYSWITTKKSPMWTFDRLVIAIALVGAMIRIGNLMNSEIYGHATTLPWGFMFVRSREWHEFYEGVACHPTQIYEALAYLALFAVLMWMYWKKNLEERPGLIFGVFFTWLFTARFLIEFVKNPQVEFERDMALNMGQLLSVPFILAGIVMIIVAMIRPRQHLEFPNRFADEPQSSQKSKVKSQK